MQDLFKRFKDFIEEKSLLKDREKALLGLSAGPDSLFLLHMFLKLRDIKKIDFLIAHFNHSLRKEADSEEKFIRRIAKKFNLKFISEKKDVKKIYKGNSLEQTARNLRYDFFLKVSRTYKIKKLALAHHKDDLVETVLLRIIRGTGLLGLRGILPISKYKSLTVIRPLLFLEKKEILEFLHKNNIEYMLDRSNFEDTYLRNKVRLKILPYLEKISPQIKDNLYNLALTSAWDYDFIYKKAREVIEKSILKESPDALELKLDGVKNLPLGILNNLLRVAIEKVKGNLRRIELRHIEEVFKLLKKEGSLSLDLPSLRVIKTPGSLLFKRKS